MARSYTPARSEKGHNPATNIILLLILTHHGGTIKKPSDTTLLLLSSIQAPDSKKAQAALKTLQQFTNTSGLMHAELERVRGELSAMTAERDSLKTQLRAALDELGTERNARNAADDTLQESQAALQAQHVERRATNIMLIAGLREMANYVMRTDMARHVNSVAALAAQPALHERPAKRARREGSPPPTDRRAPDATLAKIVPAVAGGPKIRPRFTHAFELSFSGHAWANRGYEVKALGRFQGYSSLKLDDHTWDLDEFGDSTQRDHEFNERAHARGSESERLSEERMKIQKFVHARRIARSTADHEQKRRHEAPSIREPHKPFSYAAPRHRATSGLDSFYPPGMIVPAGVLNRSSQRAAGSARARREALWGGNTNCYEDLCVVLRMGVGTEQCSTHRRAPAECPSTRWLIGSASRVTDYNPSSGPMRRRGGGNGGPSGAIKRLWTDGGRDGGKNKGEARG
ncbi:hypothetical protein FB451DRAFT_1478855 [Mycena latifolia]|nr:hypothetical protein FB451DRAFT_1478855 [Mycena latifolia]